MEALFIHNNFLLHINKKAYNKGFFRHFFIVPNLFFIYDMENFIMYLFYFLHLRILRDVADESLSSGMEYA